MSLEVPGRSRLAFAPVTRSWLWVVVALWQLLDRRNFLRDANKAWLSEDRFNIDLRLWRSGRVSSLVRGEQAPQ